MKKSIFLAALISTVIGLSAQAQQIQIDIDINPASSGLVLSQGAIQISIDTLVLARPQVSMRNGSIRIGSQVYTNRLNSAVVSGYFPAKGTLVVEESNGWGRQELRIDQLAVSNGCNGALCVNDSIYTSRVNLGRIIGFFGNGDIVVAESNGWGNQRLQSAAVAPAFGCTSQFCYGDKVLSSRKNNASVIGFFPNGDLVISEANGWGNQRVKPDSLALLKALCANIYIERVAQCGY